MTTLTSKWRHYKRLACGCAGLFALVALLTFRSTIASSPSQQESTASATAVIEVPGRTQCILTRKSTIAPVPLHPVVEVLVEPGSRVKKGQLLVKLDDDEARAEVRNKQALLENAKIALQEAQRYLAVAEKALERGALPEQRYHEIRVAALKAEKDEQSAQAALDASKAELEHFEVTAQIDGMISRLKVHPGMVSRPGTTTWGEILDLREMDAGCAVTLDQADQLAVGQTAEIRKNRNEEVFASGRVVFVGITVDKNGLVPVLVRFPNHEEALRCNAPVQVRLAPGPAVRGPK